jgi:glycosyltransferase involved in cell wall biosynthesis
MKFCFFGNISGALKDKTVGGGELQICLLARALALKGHEVIIIDPYSDESFVTPEGIKLINVPGWNKGIKGLRFFFNRIPSLWKLFAEQNADYYYVRMRGFFHLIPYFVAKKKQKKFIQAVAHDLDVSTMAKKYQLEYKANFNLFTFLTEHLLNDLAISFLLHRSDHITLQHTGQKFNSNFASKQVLFPNIINLDHFPVVQNPSKDYFVCVGSFTMLKGAASLQELINILDDRITIMIVGQPKGEKAIKIYEELKGKKNVILKGRLNHTDTINSIANAKALINTSYSEGFPNIYLEAWGTGVPVISLTVNPGDIFNNYNLGIYCNSDINKMKECIETFKSDQFNKDELIGYVEKFHDFKTAADRFIYSLHAPSNIAS